MVNNESHVICPECSSELPAGTKFCTNCGAKIQKQNSNQISTDQEAVCPQCSAKFPSGTKFCTECGCEISPMAVQEKIQLDDDHVDSMKETGKYFLRGVGNFLDKAAASIDDATQTGPIYQRKSYSENPQPAVDVEPVEDKNKGNRGYLVCEKCGGYYELEEGESPEDFESCGCGGHLNYVKNLKN